MLSYFFSYLQEFYTRLDEFNRTIPFGGFAFVDGHSEIRKWRSVTSIYSVGFAYPNVLRPFDTMGRADFSWYLEHTGYVIATTGQPQFNY